MKNPELAPYLKEERSEVESKMLDGGNGSIPELRRNDKVGYRELYSLALYHLISLVTTLLPAGAGKPVNKRRLNLQLQHAYSDVAVVFRPDILGAAMCREEGCQCHRALFNILDFDKVLMTNEERAMLGDIGPDKVEVDPDLEKLIREQIWMPQQPNVSITHASSLTDLFTALFGPEPERQGDEDEGKIKA